VGWITIFLFAYIYLFKINSLSILHNRDRAFDFLLIITVLILAWLRFNKKRV
jgi:hypothetical protein